MTTAMPGGQELQDMEIPVTAGGSGVRRRLKPSNPSNPSTNFAHGSKSVITELLSLIPSREVAALLVDTYFDRVHWFMLIFYQEDFRRKWQTLYDPSLETSLENLPNPGFISTFLLVIAIALKYTGKHRNHILETHHVNSTLLQDRIFSTIRFRLLDIVSTGSLEAVQTCVLLGTYYLYHGSPNLAWPVCGCGLRIAQALNLHRKLPVREPISAELQRVIETRKRCWWAIYEVETFCSISYGYPHGIVDEDCNVELLDPLAPSAGQSSANYNEIHQCPANLLSYKYLMSKLSVLLKDVLNDLYGIGTHQSGGLKRRPVSLHFKRLVQRVPLLDDRLQKWKAEIPESLRLTQNTPGKYSSAEEMDRDIGASGPGFESHVCQLQALALLLAYENARILVHRPLLTSRTNYGSERELEGISDPTRKTSHLSLQACRDAAMSTSYLGETPIFSLAADTYAAAFISIHTFTAGVMLCVLTSIEPLTPQSHQSKLGLRRLLKMQAQLGSKSKSPISAQGLDILERLARLVMEKELNEILRFKNEFISEPAKIRENGRPDNLNENQPDLGLDETETYAHEERVSDFFEDVTISQALSDLDQGMNHRDDWKACLMPCTVFSHHDLNMPLESIVPDLNGPLNGFNNGLAQEQAWIWGTETPILDFGQE